MEKLKNETKKELMKTLPEWVKEIETKRLEDEREAAKEQRQMSAQYDAYVSSYRSYSEEEMRDFGHTWGPGFEPDDKLVGKLADYDKVQGPQLGVLKKMIERNHPDEDINYIFLSKCGWDDDYPIDKLGKEYTYEDILLKLVEKYRSEAKFCEEKVKKYENYENRLAEIYGEHDDLLDIIISHLEKTECLQHPEFLPAGKTRLLIDEHVDMWEAYKKLGTPEEIKAKLDMLADIKKKENEWIVTDPDCFQICRPCGNEAYEFYQIQETEPEENSEKRYYGIAHADYYPGASP